MSRFKIIDELVRFLTNTQCGTRRGTSTPNAAWETQPPLNHEQPQSAGSGRASLDLDKINP
jgi:hypothetical protein